MAALKPNSVGVKRPRDESLIPDGKRLLLGKTAYMDDFVDVDHRVELNWAGGEVCPQWIADRLELPQDKVPHLEVRRANKCGPEVLYAVLVDYLYHYAVDIDQEVPDLPPKPKRKPDSKTDDQSNSDDKVNSKTDEKTDGKADGKTEEKTEKKDDKMEDSPEPVTTATAGISDNEIESTTVIDAVNGYDSDSASSSVPEDDLVDLSPSEQESLAKQSRLNTREGPGLLTTLSGTVRIVHRRHSVRAPGAGQRDPTAPSFSFGIGFSHTKYRGSKIIAAHVTRGRPGGYRALRLYANCPDTIKSFCRHAKRWHFRRYKADPQATGKYILHLLDVLPSGKGIWRNVGQKQSRSLNSIVLREGQLDAIIADFKEFRAKGTKDWYMSHGLPHRRSYLFYGPPGVGKTSTIRALAGELKLTACFLSLSDNHFQNKTLNDAILGVPRPSMLVLEDIDVLFNEHRRAQSNSFVTFSGLLNALDGLVSANGVLTIMTTNHPDRLDPALTRAGRVDRRFEFKAPDREQIKNYFLSFYPNADPKLAKKFADAVFSRPEKEARSIATLQEHFIHTRKKNAEESVACIEKFFEEFYPHSKSDMPPTYAM